VREGIVLLRQVRASDQNNYETAWRLAKFNYYLGSHTQEQSERDRAFREGVEAGRAAVKLQDAKPEGHFWLGANYGGEAEQSALAGLSSIEDIRNEMEAVIRIDETYQLGSAHMVLCQLYLEAPKIVGGDPALALQECEKGLKHGQSNALLRLRLAEAYIANKRPEDARKQINELMQMKPDPDYVPEHNEAVAKAQELLKTKLQNGGAGQR
ncbi:MAG TPA: TRAP transporter TatT component family protein, partial [Pyrinomonadaceae bacterium]|nr:TRAP transporter TatT component family protein [Pyrinomonadaceae bacterium]